jgi:hypothetical protein
LLGISKKKDAEKKADPVEVDLREFAKEFWATFVPEWIKLFVRRECFDLLGNIYIQPLDISEELKTRMGIDSVTSFLSGYEAHQMGEIMGGAGGICNSVIYIALLQERLASEAGVTEELKGQNIRLLDLVEDPTKSLGELRAARFLSVDPTEPEGLGQERIDALYEEHDAVITGFHSSLADQHNANKGGAKNKKFEYYRQNIWPLVKKDFLERDSDLKPSCARAMDKSNYAGLISILPMGDEIEAQALIVSQFYDANKDIKLFFFFEGGGKKNQRRVSATKSATIKVIGAIMDTSVIVECKVAPGCHKVTLDGMSEPIEISSEHLDVAAQKPRCKLLHQDGTEVTVVELLELKEHLSELSEEELLTHKRESPYKIETNMMNAPMEISGKYLGPEFLEIAQKTVQGHTVQITLPKTTFVEFSSFGTLRQEISEVNDSQSYELHVRVAADTTVPITISGKNLELQMEPAPIRRLKELTTLPMECLADSLEYYWNEEKRAVMMRGQLTPNDETLDVENAYRRLYKQVQDILTVWNDLKAGSKLAVDITGGKKR